MSLLELNLLHVLHVASIVVLTAFAFYAFAAAPERRKMVMIVTGVATLLVLLTGVRMWQGMYGFTMAAWVIVKLVCWVGLSALAGIGFRKRDSGLFMVLFLALATLAVVMVYWKPASS